MQSVLPYSVRKAPEVCPVLSGQIQAGQDSLFRTILGTGKLCFEQPLHSKTDKCESSPNEAVESVVQVAGPNQLSILRLAEYGELFRVPRLLEADEVDSTQCQNDEEGLDDAAKLAADEKARVEAVAIQAREAVEQRSVLHARLSADSEMRSLIQTSEVKMSARTTFRYRTVNPVSSYPRQ